MTTGHTKDSLERIMRPGTRDWAKSILALPLEAEPGSLFVYNSGASYLLSVIVQKATGQRLLDWLTPRLFVPLGIDGATWERCPRGYDIGEPGPVAAHGGHREVRPAPAGEGPVGRCGR